MRDEQTAGQDAGAQQARLLTVGAVLGVLALGWALVVILAGLANPEFLSRGIPTPKLDIPAFPSDLPLPSIPTGVPDLPDELVPPDVPDLPGELVPPNYGADIPGGGR